MLKSNVCSFMLLFFFILAIYVRVEGVVNLYFGLWKIMKLRLIWIHFKILRYWLDFLYGGRRKDCIS